MCESETGTEYSQEAIVDFPRRKAYLLSDAVSSRLFWCFAACGHVYPHHTMTVTSFSPNGSS